MRPGFSHCNVRRAECQPRAVDIGLCSQNVSLQVGFRERSRLAFVEEGVLGPLGSNRPSPAFSDGTFHLFP